MTTDGSASHPDPWQAVRLQWRALDPCLAAEPVNALAVAKQFQALAAALLAAMEAGGTPSTRFRVVNKALDLKTPKSKLAAFLNDEKSVAPGSGLEP